MQGLMEISYQNSGGFRLKGKKATVLVTPAEIAVENYKITGPGEYEIGGVEVIGLAGGVFRINIDGVGVGLIPQKLTEEEKNRIGAVNIVLTPATAELDATLEPNYVIPFGNKEDVEKFSKNLGAENVVAVSKLVTSPEKLPETTTVVVLEWGSRD